MTTQSCYRSEESEPCSVEHPGWWHLTCWNDLEEALDKGIEAVDADGDTIEKLLPGSTNRGEYRTVRLEGDSSDYSYRYWQIMVNEDPDPYSPEDEAAVLKSIAESYSNIRLSDN